MKQFHMKPEEYVFAKLALDSSKVIAFPTETVMGLGVYFDDFIAYQNLNAIKNRPEDKPYTMMVADRDDIEKYAFIDDRAKKIIHSLMPGEVTLLLKAKNNVPSYVTHGTGVIGIRIPNLDDLRGFLRAIGRPLLVPSANKSGEKPAMSSSEVKQIFTDELGYVFNGEANSGRPSTIIDLSGDEVKIIREGNVSLETVLNIIK